MVVRCPNCDTPNDADRERCHKCNARIPFALRQKAMVPKKEQEKAAAFKDDDKVHRQERGQTVHKGKEDLIGRKADIGSLRGPIQARDTGISGYSPADRYGPPPTQATAARADGGRALLDQNRYQEQLGRSAVAAPLYTDRAAWEAQHGTGPDRVQTEQALSASASTDASQALNMHAPPPSRPVAVSASHGNTPGMTSAQAAAWQAQQLSVPSAEETGLALAASTSSDPNASVQSFSGPRQRSMPAPPPRSSRGMPAPPPSRHAPAPAPQFAEAQPHYVQQTPAPQYAQQTSPPHYAQHTPAPAAGPVSAGAYPVQVPASPQAPAAAAAAPGFGNAPSYGGQFIQHPQLNPSPAREPERRFSGGQDLARPMSGEAPIREEPSRAREEPSARAGASETSLLFVDEYGRAKERLPLRPGKTIIGRTEGDVLLTNDPCVSPWHAQLAVRRSGLLIKDMYSLNGIFLRISRQALLQDGDRFCMGRQVIKFRQGWAAPQPDSQGTRAMGAANPSMAARIMVMTESGEVADQVIIRDVLTIGRAGCNLCFPEDDLLTDKHVQIQFDGRSSYMLIDLASNTGVFLALRSETELSHGDTILIGRQRLMVDRPS